MFFHGSIKSLSNRALQLSKELENAQKDRADLANQIEHELPNLNRLMPDYETLLLAELDRNVDLLDQLTQTYSTNATSGWDSARWNGWAPDTTLDFSPRLRFGELVDNLECGSRKLRLPAWLGIVGVDQTVILPTKGEFYDRSLALFQSLVLRVALELPHRVTFSLLDPAGHGRAFPMRRLLPKTEETGDELFGDLKRIQQNIRRINENYLDVSAPSFHELPEDILRSERFEFIFVADFPNGFDRRSIELLQNISANGPAAGRYAFILWNTDQDMPRDVTIEGFSNRVFVPGTTLDGFSVICDELPEPDFQEQFLSRLRAAKQPDVKIAWNEIGRIPQSDWWTGDATRRIEAKVGQSGSRGENLKVWFGVDDEGRPCAHGMLGAMTGAGKSNLYHVLIAGLATQYSPQELRLYLIDGKEGVEFAPYRRLPHADVVSLHSSPELTRSILRELVEEKERRNQLFASVGVRDLTGYRESGHATENLPRLLLLVDEYQELFEDDRDGDASSLLLQLATQGRSAGIHMLLASQRYGVPGMLNQQAIFGNIHLRIAMQMTQSDVQSLSEFGRKGKILIRACDLPGKVVINDLSGEDAGNSTGRLAFLGDSEIEDLMGELREFAIRNSGNVASAQTVVFDGNSAPNISENPHIRSLVHSESWMTAEELEVLARKSIRNGGFGMELWARAENPLPVFSGQEFNVRGNVLSVLTRRPGQNIVEIGADLNVRYGLIAAAIISLSSAVSPQDIEFVFLDGTVPNTPRSNLLPFMSGFLTSVGYSSQIFTPRDNLAPVISALKQRSILEQTPNKSTFIITVEPERFEPLGRPASVLADDKGTVGGDYRDLVRNGASRGIHHLISASSLQLLSSVLDERRDLSSFNHRIALQMNEDDSFTFTRGRKASRLNSDRPFPIAALYYNFERGFDQKFKPYTVGADFREDIDRLLNAIAERGAS